MAAATLIKITSATFKSKAIVGAQNATISIQGSEGSSRGDGAVARQSSYVEDIHAKIDVTALQGSTTDKDLMMPGNGALVIVGFAQADGSGATGGAAKTWTFPNATLANSSRGIPLDGNPSVSLNFTGVAASGLPADIYSVA